MSRSRERATKKKREKRKKINLTLKQKRILACVVAALLIIGFSCGRTIIKLQAENHSLKKQQQELQKEQSKLSKELKNIHSKDYIQDQARKQLRLLNRDEKLFIFKGEDDDKE